MSLTLGPARAPYVFTGRQGGVSAAPYTSLNLSDAVGDRPEHVAHNRTAALAALGRNDLWLRHVTQVHGARVVEARSADLSATEADGLVTSDPQAALCVFVADCVPVLLADSQGRAVAAAHAGWRGTAAQIAQSAALALCGRTGAAPQTLWAAIGPAIGPCCFMVDAPVADTLSQCFMHSHAAFVERAPGRIAVDLWALNRRSLRDVGVPAEHITVQRVCTHCSPHYFSYRRDGAPTGRQAGLIALPG